MFDSVVIDRVDMSKWGKTTKPTAASFVKKEKALWHLRSRMCVGNRPPHMCRHLTHEAVVVAVVVGLSIGSNNRVVVSPYPFRTNLNKYIYMFNI